MKQKTVEVKLKQGLEARPAAMLVQVASKHASNIYLESEGRKVNAKSIMGMMHCLLFSIVPLRTNSGVSRFWLLTRYVWA